METVVLKLSLFENINLLCLPLEIIQFKLGMKMEFRYGNRITLLDSTSIGLLLPYWLIWMEMVV